jgi:adenine-specific DNA-methyltransferase
VCAERLRRVIHGYQNKKGERVEGLDGAFSYLRAKRIPAARVFNDIQHSQVWLALQLIHDEALTHFDEAAKVQVSGSSEARLVYVPKLNAATLKEVARIAALGGSLTVYSWQPGQLRQRIEVGNAAFEKIPEFLVKRFGGGK